MSTNTMFCLKENANSDVLCTMVTPMKDNVHKYVHMVKKEGGRENGSDPDQLRKPPGL